MRAVSPAGGRGAAEAESCGQQPERAQFALGERAVDRHPRVADTGLRILEGDQSHIAVEGADEAPDADPRMPDLVAGAMFEPELALAFADHSRHGMPRRRGLRAAENTVQPVVIPQRRFSVTHRHHPLVDAQSTGNSLMVKGMTLSRASHSLYFLVAVFIAWDRAAGAPYGSHDGLAMAATKE
ncbi:hypothetical protein ACU4GI_03740 [Cupriavidus basilensis]